ncbi:MAG: glycine zipper 2TM domain-containing protein [Candidatus Competibacteraceae bacterium]|jgi:outer membrane lipoprotein SlyB|nr:glycine zipper 2TM domain-containing protein [Candidatus Competibacteraceae bacterium]
METKTTPLVAVLLLGLLISGCAPSLSGSAYSRSQARETQQVQFGTVEGVRNVLIEGTKSGVGTVSGAALGGLAGSTVGGGRGKAAATIGGAVLGGLAGAAAEEGVTRQQGLEITVRLDNGRFIAVTQAADEIFNPGERVRILTGNDGTTRVTR